MGLALQRELSDTLRNSCSVNNAPRTARASAATMLNAEASGRCCSCLTRSAHATSAVASAVADTRRIQPRPERPPSHERAPSRLSKNANHSP